MTAIENRIHKAMIHCVTQYDIKESKKKYYNRYALGRYIERINEIENKAKLNKVDYKSSILFEIANNFHNPLRDKLLLAVKSV